MATRALTAADQYLEQPYEIALVRRDGEDGATWSAQVVEFPGCEGSGPTEEDALASARQAMSAWVQDALDNNRPIPSPRASAVHSGRLLVRMPPSLHSELARVADREKVSLNTLILCVLGGAVSWRQPGDVETPAVRTSVATSAPAESQDESREAGGPDRARWLKVALTANLVIVVVAGLVAIGLMVAVLTS